MSDPDLDFLPIPDPRVKKAPDPGVKKAPDPGVKKAPDPGSGSATLLKNTNIAQCSGLVVVGYIR